MHMDHFKNKNLESFASEVPKGVIKDDIRIPTSS